MAITRKLLKGMGLTEEQQDTIIEAHTDTVNGLKADIDLYKADAEKLPAVLKELDGYKSKGNDGYKEKYDAEHKAFEEYKTSVAAEKTTAAKEKALEAALKKIGIDDKRISTVAKMAKADGLLDALELDENGAAKDAAKFETSLKDGYGEFVVTTSTQGATTANPPANNGSGAGSIDAAAFAKMGYTARLQLKKDSPEKYAELTKPDNKGD